MFIEVRCRMEDGRGGGGGHHEAVVHVCRLHLAGQSAGEGGDCPQVTWDSAWFRIRLAPGFILPPGTAF